MTAVAAAVPVGARTPWKGLAPYDDSSADAGLFFGRDREIAVACANLRATRLTVLFGASGVGKSSLLRAGVIRQLRDDGEAAVLVSSWTGDPVAAIAAAARDAVEAALGREIEDPGGSLAARLRQWTDELGADLLLVLDQAEEYFLYHEGESGPGTFAAEFPGLVTERGLRVNVLLGIREDALGQLDTFRAAVPGVLSNYLRLERLDRDAGRLAILGPIACWNAAVLDDPMTAEPELVEAVLDEVAAGRIEPEAGGLGGVTPSALVERIEAPYLQLVLERLWETERAAGSIALRRETLRQLGGAALIVEEHVERSLAGLDRTERLGVAVLFAYLVTPSGTKVAHRVDDLATYSGLPLAATAALVGRLVHERILRPADGGRVEIYHDVLASAVADWRREQEAAEALEQERKRHRRLLAILVGSLVALALVGALAVYAVSQRNEAREKTALAQANEQKAEQQTALAQANEQEAQKQVDIADNERDAAQEARDEANASAAEADKQKGIAEQEAAEAEASKQQAQASAAEADQQREIAEEQAAAAEASEDNAQEQAEIADTQRQRAESAEGAAKREAQSAKEQATLATARQQTALATSLLTTDPERSVRHALEALRLRPRLPEAEDALRRSLIELRLGKVLAGGSPVNTATFSSDGALVATAGDGGEARVFRTVDGRLLQRLRHAGGVVEVAFSPDRRLVATAVRGGTAVIWNVDTGARVHTFRHGGAVRSVAFSPDGRLVVTASNNGLAVLWDVGSGLQLLTVPHPRAVQQARFSPDGRFFATQTDERFVRVVEIASGRTAATLEQQGEVTDVQWSPIGNVLVTTGRRNAYVWSTGDWTRSHLLEGHTAAIRDAAMSADGLRVLTVGVDGSGRVWRVDTGALVFTAVVHRAEVTAGAFSPDATFAVTASHDATARVWPPGGGRFSIGLFGHRNTISSVSFSPDGRRVLTSSLDGEARLWDPTGDPDLGLVGRHEGGATVAQFNPDAALVVSGGADRTATIRRRGGGLVATLPHGGRVTVGTFVVGGRRVLTASEDGSARLWTPSGAVLATFAHGSPVRAAAVSPDGSLVVTAADDGAVRVWRAGGTPVRVLGHGGPVRVVRFSPDGERLLTASDDRTARIWRVSDGRLLRTLAHPAPVTAAAFTADGTSVVTGAADRFGRLWNANTGTLRHDLGPHEDAITSVSFNRAGTLALVADRAGDMRTWNVRTGSQVNPFRGHVSLVSEARFSPDGRWVVTAGPSAAGLWAVRTGELIFYLRGHVAPLNAASFSADGRWILTAARDGSVRRYHCVLCGNARELEALARSRLRTLRP